MFSIQNFKTTVANYQLKVQDLNLAAGEITLLYGPSGSGKTSFLMGLLGLLPSTYTLNLPLPGGPGDLGELPAEQKHCGVVFQFDNLFEHLTVYKNLLLVKDKSQSEIEFKKHLDSFGIDTLLNKKASVLSGGEQQIVACLRLFLQQNKSLILLDEPWSSMDPANKNKYRTYLLEHLKQANLPCILISHDEEEAKSLSPRFNYDFNQVAFFEKGQP